jgi:carbon-monoxide dehydrogenase medium subunit
VIPAPFAYARASSLREALERLAADGGATRPLAGGQSLLPLMKLRLAQPERLLDIGRLAELRGVRSLSDGRVAVGALATWADLLADPSVMPYGCLADTLPGIADLQVRHRGTIGGSLAHADPASDIAAPLLALGAEVVVRSIRGERAIPMADLDLGPFATALEPDELIVEVRLPGPRADAGSAYRSLRQPASGYPIAGVAVVAGGGLAAIGVTGVGEVPYRATAAEAALRAGAGLAEVAALVTEGIRVAADVHADARYRAAMAGVMARRALEAALARV